VAVVLAVLASGCAGSIGRPTAPGPGTPTVRNLRIDPDTVRAGEPATLRFEFEAPSANIAEILVFVNRVGDWSFTAGLGPTRLSGRDVSGIAVGEFVTPLRPREVGILYYEVLVVDEQGNHSNRLRSTLTVRP
jgi:hypothetical protein